MVCLSRRSTKWQRYTTESTLAVKMNEIYRNRHTNTQTQRHRHIQTHTDTQTHRHTDTQTHRHTDTDTLRHTHAHAYPSPQQKRGDGYLLSSFITVSLRFGEVNALFPVPFRGINQGFYSVCTMCSNPFQPVQSSILH